jgi:hypothetical protein
MDEFLVRHRDSRSGGESRAKQEERQAALFEKSAQKLLHAGPWALAPSAPMARSRKVFLILFLQKKKRFLILAF